MYMPKYHRVIRTVMAVSDVFFFYMYTGSEYIVHEMCLQINYPLAILPCTYTHTYYIYTLYTRVSSSSYSIWHILDRPPSVFFDQGSREFGGENIVTLDLVTRPGNWFEVFVESRAGGRTVVCPKLKIRRRSFAPCSLFYMPLLILLFSVNETKVCNSDNNRT